MAKSSATFMKEASSRLTMPSRVVTLNRSSDPDVSRVLEWLKRWLEFTHEASR